MKIRKKLLLPSTIIVLMTVPLIPYSYSDGLKFRFGYPISYFTAYDLAPIRNNEILVSRIGFYIPTFILDVAIVYIVLALISYLVNKLTNNRT